MAGLDERVAYLEGRMEDHSALMADIRSEMRALRSDMDRRFDHLDQKIDRRFTWLVGVLVGVLLALVSLALQVSRLQPL